MVDYRVALGDVLSVDYAVENQGETVGEQAIKLLVDSTQEDSDTGVIVDVGVTETGTLQWDTSGATAQEYTVSVESADTSDQFTLEVVDPTNTAFYLVDIDSTNSPILDKQTLDVTATIENVGDQSGTQDITLDIDGTQEDSITGKSLAAGASDTVTLNWTVPSGATGDKTATVNSADDFDDVTITVEQGSGFEVAIDSTNEPVTEGDTLNVQATIENTGLAQDTQFITLDIDNGVGTVDSTNVTLAPDSAKTVVLEWATQDGDGGTTYTATVNSLDDSATASVAVENKPSDANGANIIWSTSAPSGAVNQLAADSDIAVVGDNDQLTVLDTSDGSTQGTYSGTTHGVTTDIYALDGLRSHSNTGGLITQINNDDTRSELVMSDDLAYYVMPTSGVRAVYVRDDTSDDPQYSQGDIKWSTGNPDTLNRIASNGNELVIATTEGTDYTLKTLKKEDGGVVDTVEVPYQVGYIAGSGDIAVKGDDSLELYNSNLGLQWSKSVSSAMQDISVLNDSLICVDGSQSGEVNLQIRDLATGDLQNTVTTATNTGQAKEIVALANDNIIHSGGNSVGDTDARRIELTF
jgi:hypothetical protein